MNAKDDVKQYFPDAYLEKEGVTTFTEYFVLANTGFMINIIGDDNTEERAWENAKQWIDGLSDENKPKIVSHE